MSQSTKAGLIIAKQRGNPDKAIASLATEIVVKWKKTVEEEKAKKQHKMNGLTPAKKGSISSPASSQAATPAPATPTQSSKGFHGDPTTRKYATDGLKPVYPDQPARNGCVVLIYNGLAYVSWLSTQQNPCHEMLIYAPGLPRDGRRRICQI